MLFMVAWNEEGVFAQAKGHDLKFKVATLYAEGGFAGILLPHQNLMIALPQVNIQKIIGIAQFIKELIYSWMG